MILRTLGFCLAMGVAVVASYELGFAQGWGNYKNCDAFGKANHCHASYSNASKTCTCSK
jgi:hypothetical protein